MAKPVFVLADKAKIVFEELRLAAQNHGEKTLGEMAEPSPDLFEHGWLTKEAAEEFKGLVADPDRPGNWIKREEKK